MDKHKKLEEHIYKYLASNSVDVKDLCYNDRCLFDTKYEGLVEKILLFVDNHYFPKSLFIPGDIVEDPEYGEGRVYANNAVDTEYLLWVEFKDPEVFGFRFYNYLGVRYKETTPIQLTHKTKD